MPYIPVAVVNEVGGMVPNVDARAAAAISTFGPSSLGLQWGPDTTGFSWPSAGQAIFIPFRIATTTVINKMCVGSGTVAGGNLDLGIYDTSGARLAASGSVARGVQTENIGTFSSDLTLAPGMYYMAMSADGTNGYAGPVPGVNVVKLGGMREATGAFPLPSSVTLATCTFTGIPSLAAYIKLGTGSAEAASRWPPLNMLTSYHPESGSLEIYAANAGKITGATSGTLGANVVNYQSFWVSETCTARTMVVHNGATATGNVDVGIYSTSGTRLVNSGSVGQTGTNTLQEIDIANTDLSPGWYFMAMTFSSASATVFRNINVDEFALSALPLYTETTGGFGLPATATFTLSTAANPPIPLIGINFDSIL